MTADGGDGDEDEDELQQETVYPSMRDEILGSLALASSDRERSPHRHGAQEGEGGPPRSTTSAEQRGRGRTTHDARVFWGTSAGPTRSGQPLRGQCERNVERLSTVRYTACIRGTCSFETGRTAEERRENLTGGEEADQAPQQQENCLRRPGGIFGQAGED